MISRLLITGCSQGLGRALACEFAQLDCSIYAVSRNEHLLNELANTSHQIHPIVADIATSEGRAAIYKQIDKYSPLSIIHNAAIAVPTQFKSLDEALLREHMEINFFAPLLITQELLPLLSQKQRVLNITSGAASLPLSGLMPYCASKTAIQLAMQCLNVELKSRGIFFSNLSPGMVETAMQEELRNSDERTLPNRDFYRSALKEGKLIPPEIVAKFAAWLMLKTKDVDFTEKVWSIYDQSHHSNWLSSEMKGLFFS